MWNIKYKGEFSQACSIQAQWSSVFQAPTHCWRPNNKMIPQYVGQTQNMSLQFSKNRGLNQPLLQRIVLVG